MKTVAAALIAFLLITPVISAAGDTDVEMKNLQGKWFLNHTERDGTTIRIIKSVEGKQETVSVYRDDLLVHEQVADFEIKKNDQLTVLTLRNQRITAGPNKGNVIEEPISFISQVRGNWWIVAQGLLNADDLPPHVDMFERLKDKPATENQTEKTGAILLTGAERPLPEQSPTNELGATLAVDKELQRLQGEWSVVSLTNQGVVIPERLCQQSKVLIYGKVLTIDKLWWRIFPKTNDQIQNGETAIGEYPGRAFVIKVRPNGILKEVDLTLIDVLPVKGEEADLSPAELEGIRKRRIQPKGIYELEADELRICWGEWRGASTRPTEFNSAELSDRILLVLKRKKPE